MIESINVLMITTLQASSYPKRAEQGKKDFMKHYLVYFSSKYLPFYLLT